MSECLTAHISTHKNLGDLATKVIPGGWKCDYFVGWLLYDITEDRPDHEAMAVSVQWDEEALSRFAKDRKKKSKRRHTWSSPL